MKGQERSLEDVTIVVECVPRLIRQGAMLRVDASVSGPSVVFVPALDLLLLDKEGKTRLEAREAVRPIVGLPPREPGIRRYTLDVLIADGYVLPFLTCGTIENRVGLTAHRPRGTFSGLTVRY